MPRGLRKALRDLRSAKRLIEEHEYAQAIRVLEALSDRTSSPQQKEKINKLLLVANKSLGTLPLDQPINPVSTIELMSLDMKSSPADDRRLLVTESIESDRADQEERISAADQEFEAMPSVHEESSPEAAVERCSVRLYWEVKPMQSPAMDPDQGGFDVSLILGFSQGHVIRVRYLRIQKAWSRWPVVLDDPELELGGNEGPPSINVEAGLLLFSLFSPSFRRNWLSRHLFCPRLGWHAEVWIEIEGEKSSLELEAWCFRRRVWRWTREVPGYQCSPAAVFPKEAQS